MAGRGAAWEALIESALALYADRHTIVPTDPPVQILRRVKGGRFEVVFRAKGQCDYEGALDGAPVVLDAKEQKQVRFDLRQVKEHQLARMRKTSSMGGLGGVLFRSTHPKADPAVCYLITARAMNAALDEGKKSLSLQALRDMTQSPQDSGVYGFAPVPAQLMASIKSAIQIEKGRACHGEGGR